MRALERYLLLQIIDQRWREHLYDMDYLREGIHLRGFAQIDPLVAYKNEAFTLFSDLMNTIWSDFSRMIFHVEVRSRARTATRRAAVHAVGLVDAVGPRLLLGRRGHRAAQRAGRGRGRPRGRRAAARVAVQQRRVAEVEQIGRNDPAGAGRARSSSAATAPSAGTPNRDERNPTATPGGVGSRPLPTPEKGAVPYEHARADGARAERRRERWPRSPHLYPHDALPDAVYARVSAKLDEAAGEDAAQAQTINEGAADLDGRGDQPFVERSAEQQLADAKAIAGSDFFELVRSTAVVEIYSDAQTWAAFGYEGPSFEKGGYIDRGFDDLDWLPDPEQEA
jgi:hypothetical protein